MIRGWPGKEKGCDGEMVTFTLAGKMVIEAPGSSGSNWRTRSIIKLARGVEMMTYIPGILKRAVSCTEGIVTNQIK